MAGAIRADERAGAFVELAPDIHHGAGARFQIAGDFFLCRLNERAQRGVKPVLNSGIERVDIIEMPVDGAKADLCLFGDLLAGRRGLAALDQLEQRVDDFLFRLRTPCGAAIGFFDETDFYGSSTPSCLSPCASGLFAEVKALGVEGRAFSVAVWLCNLSAHQMPIVKRKICS
ncbi:hypothetical protein [Tepidicaulis sp.]|uniref:hypothetical protein n=1 Tax=Tepidicaulis sp. TaxID=1920809 RepID=UPI003B594F6E